MTTATSTDSSAGARTQPRIAVAGVSGYAGGELARLLLHHPALDGTRPVFLGRAGEAEVDSSTSLEDLHPNLAIAAGAGAESGISLQLEPDRRRGDRSAVSGDAARAVARMGSPGHRAGHQGDRPQRRMAAAGIPQPRRLSAEGCRPEARCRIADRGCLRLPGAAPRRHSQRAAGCQPRLLPHLRDSCACSPAASGSGRSRPGHYLRCEVGSQRSRQGALLRRRISCMPPTICPLTTSSAIAMGASCSSSSHLNADQIQFTPHLLPIPRGILTTIYLKLKDAAEPSDLTAVLADFYRDSPMVRLYPTPQLPQIQHVVRTNYCDIGFELASRWQAAGDGRVSRQSFEGRIRTGRSEPEPDVRLGRSRRACCEICRQTGRCGP